MWSELCPAKTHLSIFVVVIPKEETKPFYMIPAIDFVVCVIPRKGLDGLLPTKPSFGMMTAKICRPILAWCGSFAFLFRVRTEGILRAKQMFKLFKKHGTSLSINHMQYVCFILGAWPSPRVLSMGWHHCHRAWMNTQKLVQKSA